MIHHTKLKRSQRQRRHKRVRARIFGSKNRPRLSVFRSSQHLHLQLIDDQSGRTLASVNTLKSRGGDKTSQAKAAGSKLAEKALEKGISEVVFDRGGYKYHGRVKAAAESAREKGLKF